MWRASQGTNVITGALILNGITCGMVFRPLRPTVGRTLSVTGRGGGGRGAGQPRSVIFVRIMEEKQRRRTTSTGSLDGSTITRDDRLVRPEPTESQATSLRVIREHETEHAVDHTQVVLACRICH